MFKNKIIMLLLSLSLILFVSGCSQLAVNDNSKELEDSKAKIEELEESNNTLKAEIEELNQALEKNNHSENMTKLSAAVWVVEKLEQEDFQAISAKAHPTKGIRFTPYSNVDLNNDIVLTQNDLSTIDVSNNVYTWGAYDGTGDPIELVFSEYYSRFIYDAQFANPQIIGVNDVVQSGNSIENVDSAYPDADFYTFHFSELDPQYEGMDWRNLKIVLEEYNGDYYIVGLIHSEWTI